MLIDITERKRAEEQQSLMVRELHHRVKNTLATVQAIMGSTAPFLRDHRGVQDRADRRIASLAKTHRLLDRRGRRGFVRRDTAQRTRAFDDGSEGRIRLPARMSR